MKALRWTAWGLMTASLAAGSVPVEDFARSPLVSHAQLSPDGQHVAFLREYEGKQTLFLTDLKDRKLARVVPATEHRSFESKDVSWFRWVGDRRLVFAAKIWDHAVTGVSAVDVDGRRWKTISGAESKVPNEDRLWAQIVIHVCDDAEQNILMLDEHKAEGEARLFPDVVKVSTLTGHYARVARNPGDVVSWGVDGAGCVRFGITQHDLKYGSVYREREDAPWRQLMASGEDRGEIKPLGVEGSGQRLYVVARSAQKRAAIYPCDATDGSLGAAIVEDRDYDIVPSKVGPVFDGFALAHGVFSPAKHTLAGVYFVADGPRVRWLDPGFAARQRAIDRALPDTFNLITSASRDDRRWLVLAFSDRNPGTYYLFDSADNSLTLVGTRMGWIKPAQMAPMESIQYPARDGLTIHGYLTFPSGAQREHLPLVVMPHGGPWVRDIWAFDPLVQMLASRGWAVLQMNYRGSTGFGEDFSDRGRREVGRAIQDDIEDGTRWAITRGVADARRIAILGGSYGGYAALFALGHNPELYRCGVSIAGVTDWPKIFESRADPQYKFAREYWVEQIGDPGKESSFLQSISPVNFAGTVRAPVLIIQGKEDETVPPDQARAMVTALEKAGHKPESLFVASAGHNLGNEAARIEIYRRIAAFLEKNLAP